MVLVGSPCTTSDELYLLSSWQQNGVGVNRTWYAVAVRIHSKGGSGNWLSRKHLFHRTTPRSQPGGKSLETCDPNRFFTVLKHISMEPGYSLDYIYLIDRDVGGYAMGGEPSLCALAIGEQETGNSSSGF